MPPKVSDSYKEEKRNALLDSAFECFAIKGYADTKIDDIVTHAKTSKGAIYNYFKSKEEIFLQILENRNELVLERARAQLSEMGSAVKMVRQILAATVKVAQRDDNPKHFEEWQWGILHLEFLLYASRHEDLQPLVDEHYVKFMRFYEEVMEAGVRFGEFRSDLDTHAAASLFWKLTNGMALQFSLMGHERAYDPVVDGAVEMMFHYLGCKGDGSSSGEVR